MASNRLSQADIAVLLGCTKQAVSDLKQRGKLPKPAETINQGATPLWRRTDIEKWMKERG